MTQKVKIEIMQPKSIAEGAVVKFNYKGVVKTYKVVFTTT